VDDDVYQGMRNVLSRYPGLKVVGQVNGNWTESVTQQAVAGLLPSLPQVDAVLSEGNDAGGAMAAFRQADRRPLPLVIMGNSGQDLREWQQAAAEQPGYQTMSVSSFPSMSSVALWIAYLASQGKKLPNLTYVPVLTIPEQNRDAWARATGYAEVANNVLTQRDTERFTDAQAAGQPVYVSAPQPTSNGS
jgi:ribose transport system substrate-binding protein